MSKYRNRKVKADGYTFDSQAEYARYCELKQLKRAGEIDDFNVHPKYELQPSFKRNGKTIRAITYSGDFSYRENGRVVVEDVKGVRTQVFDLKSKMFQFKYPDIELRITA